MTDSAQLTACKAGQCLRKVKEGTAYCCTPCSIAWESTPRWDIDGAHSPGCDERAAERGEYSPAEAEMRRAGGV